MAPTTKRLVIVESPAKAKTIAGYLGDDYIVESSLGHIRDLPRNAKEIPAEHAKKPWARLGVDVEHDFTPLYVVNPDRKAHVKVLKDALKQVDELLLATDEDREGEAIAYHLLETLKPKVPVKRMVFHEITKPAIEAAVANPREIYQSLVDAQEARRILDRLYGYEVSPVLWKKVRPRLSAGRVQSVATRIVVERERARMRFVTADYWGITAHLRTADGTEFAANLLSFDGDRVATGKDFEAETGRPRSGVVQLDEAGARGLAARLSEVPYTVGRVENKPYRRRPYAPFITSTLQQEASRKLRQSSAQTMRIAQRLYDNGYITYMRTDSTNLSDTALNAARRQAAELYGPQYVPAEPRRYSRKVKNAQEAHEAIRPAGDTFRTPQQLANELSTEDMRLYELIWRRTIASQMTDAVGNSVSVRISATSRNGEECEFGASGKTITDPGFLKAYVESRDEGETDDAERRLPELERGQELTADRLDPAGHRTQPPARYTEASLVKALEERGIGRPSTYASIMQTIQDRGYVFKRGQALIPAFLAFAVVGLMENHFGRLVDYDFTAGMESELDNIAAGEARALNFLRDFYFGGAGGEGSVAAAGGLKHLVAEELGRIDARGVNSIPLFTDDQDRRVVARVGQYGPYLERFAPDAPADEPGERVSIPESMAPDEVTPEKVEELYEIGSGERELGDHPDTGEPVYAKSGRYGPYVVSGEKSASLLSDMKLPEITLEDAVRLLTLPRLVGVDDDGEEIRTGQGPHGPYVVKKRDYRSLTDESQLFTLTMDEARRLLAQPKQRGRARPPLKELGEDPATKLHVVIKDGRFGPYATDGETNASLKKTDTIEDITIDRASELLAERRSKAPAPKKAAKKATAKKATKAAAKKTTKKTAAKKAAKKTAAAGKSAKQTTTRTVKKAAAKKTAKKKTGDPRKDG
ncbi:DNA topoisomerase-1 [Stackebrandtia albiflava]|uniref:DNA topoisomerase 1 n=1 Tax=Stackebrandtia albiflava TaxID=406432 RepID=A0A562V2E0_9ACTN|nr:type I DNA topoisomerase [Stackebrandtia albiflava]TWJ12041.1 DNA topoisomerase-1 [Stackebrandtia albiflava]